MDLVKPMLATATTVLPKGTWIAEEKFDGHRLLIRKDAHAVMAWSRLGNLRPLPRHLNEALVKLPLGLYDGELIVPAGYSSSVSELSNEKHLRYVVFDLLEYEGRDITAKRWKDRRGVLESIFPTLIDKSPVLLTPIHPVQNWHDVEHFVEQIWSQGGEGAILKDVNAPYVASLKTAKRTKHFLKVKECQPAVLTVRGFCESEGEVLQLGDFGTVVLQDNEGLFTLVKVLDTDERSKLEEIFMKGSAKQWAEARLPSGKKIRYFVNHPFVGRRLAIEFQNRTPDRSYRHPRWDHWED